MCHRPLTPVELSPPPDPSISPCRAAHPNKKPLGSAGPVEQATDRPNIGALAGTEYAASPVADISPG